MDARMTPDGRPSKKDFPARQFHRLCPIHSFDGGPPLSCECRGPGLRELFLSLLAILVVHPVLEASVHHLDRGDVRLAVLSARIGEFPFVLDLF
jgi:hypothetical protein